jgi:hypothetical protein
MTERAKHWAGMLRDWERSGLSQAAFCRGRGIHYVTFSWWKRRLGQNTRGQARLGHGQFIEVPLAAPCSPPMYEVVLTSGRVLRVPERFEAGAVSRLLAVVEGAC